MDSISQDLMSEQKRKRNNDKENSLSKNELNTFNQLNTNQTTLNQLNTNQLTFNQLTSNTPLTPLNSPSQTMSNEPCESTFTAIKPLNQLEISDAIGVLIALGSNLNASQALDLTRELLQSEYGNIGWSTEFINPDYTATASNPKPDYTNQCGYFTLDSNYKVADFNLNKVVMLTKHIESRVQQHFSKELERAKQHTQNRQVIIDIDVLAIKAEEGMVAIKERYPFKSHEWVGINELINQGYFD